MTTPSRPRVTSAPAQELHVCPGGAHEPLQSAIRKALAGRESKSPVVGVAPVGCALLLYEALDVDCVAALPGWGPSTAAGIKKSRPDSLVFAYQGGWDAASVGIGEILHAAGRGDPITVIYKALEGVDHGVELATLVTSVEGSAFVEEIHLGGEESLPLLYKALEQAFDVQDRRLGFGFIEVHGPDSDRKGGGRSG